MDALAGSFQKMYDFIGSKADLTGKEIDFSPENRSKSAISPCARNRNFKLLAKCRLFVYNAEIFSGGSSNL